jgi:hypothetical protein
MKGELNKDRTPPWAVQQGSIMVPGKARLQLQSEYYNLITIFLKMLTFSVRKKKTFIPTSRCFIYVLINIYK